uniref:Uncharacterized protein n=1 Tax=Solanum tuberosum TaxID=4113 RepID=M1DNR4_SOLTU
MASGISQGLQTSGKQYRPMAGGISKGLHASDVACAHRANNVGQWEVELAKACILRIWHVRIGQAMETLAMAYSHQPGVIDHGLSASARRHRPWHANIGCGLRASPRRYRPLSAHIGRGLRA